MDDRHPQPRVPQDPRQCQHRSALHHEMRSEAVLLTVLLLDSDFGTAWSQLGKPVSGGSGQAEDGQAEAARVGSG